MSTAAASAACGGGDPAALGEQLAQLRLQLLDLTGRNRLLNLKPSPRRSLAFIQGDLFAVFDAIAGGGAVDLLPLPEPPAEHWTERNGKLERPEPRAWAQSRGLVQAQGQGQGQGWSFDLAPGGAEAATKPSLLAPFYGDILAQHCRFIERQARLALDETGANMLFLTLGVLEYPDQPGSEEMFIAPLICVPVRLTQRRLRGMPQYGLEMGGDEIAENLSLRQKLLRDHDFQLPELFDAEGGIAPAAHFAQLRALLAERPGFAFHLRASLCLLSFTNMLLVRDLDPRAWPETEGGNGLLSHPIIRALLGGERPDSGAGLGRLPEHAVEEEPGKSLPLVFDADSSQHSALVDVIAGGRSLVIEGPPGTGKSQTIANLIGAALAQGKKVLFVADKTAALEVVRARLEQAGLAPFVLELHSDKAGRKRVLDDLRGRLDFEPAAERGMAKQINAAEVRRVRLQAHAELLSSVICNRLGLTLHEILWRAERHRLQLDGKEARLGGAVVKEAAELTADQIQQRLECLQRLADDEAALGEYGPARAFWGFFPIRMLPSDEAAVMEAFTGARAWAAALARAAAEYAAVLGDPHIGFELEPARRQRAVLAQAGQWLTPDLPLHLLPQLLGLGAAEKAALAALQTQIDAYRGLEAAVRRGLRRECAVGAERRDDLIELARRARALGCELGTPAELRAWLEALETQLKRLVSAWAAVRAAAAESGWELEPGRAGLEQALRLAACAADFPHAEIFLQTAALAAPGCPAALEALIDRQREWRDLEAQLGRTLYLDQLPPAAKLEKALAALRRDRGWWRALRPRWHGARALHRRLRRERRWVNAGTRLAEMEEIVRLVKLKQDWRSSPAWSYLRPAEPAENAALAGPLTLARWDAAVQTALESVRAHARLESPAQAAQLQQALHRLSGPAAAATAALAELDRLLPELRAANLAQPLDQLCEQLGQLAALGAEQLPWVEQHSVPEARLAEHAAACAAAAARQEMATAASIPSPALGFLGIWYQGIHTDVAAIERAIEVAGRIVNSGLSPAIRAYLARHPPAEALGTLGPLLERLIAGMEEVERLGRELEEFGDFDPAAWSGIDARQDFAAFAAGFEARLGAVQTHGAELPAWGAYARHRAEAAGLELEPFLNLSRAAGIPASLWTEAYSYCVHRGMARAAFRELPELANFDGISHSQCADEYRHADQRVLRMRGGAIAAAAVRHASPPEGDYGPRVAERTEMALLRHLLPQQRPRLQLRVLLARAGAAIRELKPCFMMSPQSVAQYLVPNCDFDLVIMDEASQLKPEEALGAVARGRQLVVAGDPKQLPPTTFFSRLNQELDEEQAYIATDAESILDSCAAQLPTRRLRWHYRSRHHSLIAFSNRHFYEDELIVFPSPFAGGGAPSPPVGLGWGGGQLGVRTEYLADAVYEDRLNWPEARRVVELAAEHIRDRAEESLGIITLNAPQCDLISELLDRHLPGVPGAEAYKEHWAARGQRLLVKNLENFQGDERDAILISTTFGKPPGAGVVRQNFGPISRDGGWRRLNVLFTRARRSVTLVTSLRPEDIVDDATTPAGTRALRAYLEYARTGQLELPRETGRAPDSDFEISVLHALRRGGYDATPQLGVAGFRLDLAVLHPDRSGAYLAAIECDGASYHAARSVRDRDRIRQEILESMGWRGRLWRIWSTDWFRDPARETGKLLDFLAGLKSGGELASPV